jgi:hypothetical protein
MRPLSLKSCWMVTLLAASLLGVSAPNAPGTRAASATAATCAGLTLDVHPGVNRAGSKPAPASEAAPDAPRGSFSVSLPPYPEATPLSPWAASPYPETLLSAYLQTAGAEYQSSDSATIVSAWFRSHLPACGWHTNGYWNGNASVFTAGRTFVSNANPDLSVEMSYGHGASDGSYIGYGVEWIIYPPRPAASYLHGPFTQVRIARRRPRNILPNSSLVQRVVHTTVRDRTEIRRLVSAINSVGGYHTVPALCLGGGAARFGGPAWLAFIRPDSSAVHAYEIGPGACLGLAVNSRRWLIDTGVVWKQILRLTRP